MQQQFHYKMSLNSQENRLQTQKFNPDIKQKYNHDIRQRPNPGVNQRHHPNIKQKPSIIIPKIKNNINDDYLNINNNSKTSFTKIQTKIVTGIQSKQDKNISSTEYKNIPNNHVFLTQFQIQKMSKQQLAQTYYEQSVRLHKQNDILHKQLAFIRYQRDKLYKKYLQLKQEQKQSENKKPKRHRRVADQIQRNFNCPIEKCNKVYGSEGSLLQHIKLKHEEYARSKQYEDFLQNRKLDSQN